MDDVIDLRAFKSIVNGMLDFLIEQRGIAKLRIPREHDHYWSIEGETHSPVDPRSAIAPVPTIGSLSQDWEFLRPLLKDREQPDTVMLVHVAPIMRYIGQVGVTCSNA